MLSIPHLLLVLVIVMILFGSKLPKIMGDLGKGIRNLRDELNHDDSKTDEARQQILPPEDKLPKN